MALPLYIDNETPWDGDYGDWDSLVEQGSSTIERSQAAAEPSRGYWGLRCRTVSGSLAYVTADGIGLDVALGKSLFVGFWLYVAAPPAELFTMFLRLVSTAIQFATVRLYADRKLRARAYNDAGGSAWTGYSAALSGWRFICVEVRRGAGDGYLKLYVDGELACQTAAVDNDTRAADLKQVDAGCRGYARDSLDIHLDEFRAADELLTSDLRGCYNLYRGADGEAYVDYDHPVRSVLAGVATIDLHGLGHDADRDYCYVCRAVSDAGVEERNTHVLAYAHVDAEGNLLTPPLARPGDLAATVFQDASVRLEFSCGVPEGHATPELFEIFTDVGTGGFDLETPIASVSADGAEREDYEVTLTPSVLPARFAVWARAASRVGPLSRSLLVAQSPSPLPATVL